METKRFFIGIDTSKATLDIAVRFASEVIVQEQIANTKAAVRKLIKGLRKHPAFHMNSAVFCLEHTGLYNAHVLQVLTQMKAFVAQVAALDIKQSLGLQRGKSDRVDARRIAEYAERFVDKLQAWEPPRPVLQRLQHLLSLRERLIKTRTQLEVPLQEARAFLEPGDYRAMEQACHASLNGLQRDIERIDKQIQELIRSDEELHKRHQQIKSVPGIGDITASEILIRSNEFKAFTDPKKFACHAGVAPFEHQSGSSVRGRTRVSHRAHKRLKTLLHLAAMAAIKVPGELRDYYQRKVAEGKHKMAVLNAVRNKLILRVFAIVRDGVMYQKNYNYSLREP